MAERDLERWDVVERIEQPGGVVWAKIRAGQFGTLEVYWKAGYHELHYSVVGVAFSKIESQAVVAGAQRGECLLRGQLVSKWPTQWDADWDEETDGPKVADRYSMTVGGLAIDVLLEEAPGVVLAIGLWIEVRLEGLTVFA